MTDKESLAQAAGTILVVDDDKVFRLFLRDFLEDMNFEVLEAPDGKSGLDIYYEKRPDALLVDLYMPEMSGLEVLQKVEEDSPAVPVIVVSGEGGMDDAVAALRHGAWDYVIKGKDATRTLQQVLMRALEDSRQLLRESEERDKLAAEAENRRNELQDFRERLEQELEDKERLAGQLEREQSQVRDMTVTLKNVIHTVDEDKDDFKVQISQYIESTILPTLDKMAREPSPEIRKTYKDVLQSQLASMTEGSSRELDSDLMRLTPTELEVCRYIKTGKTTGEIADLLNSSLETIQTHRKNIRRKLGLVGKSVSLHVYLRSKSTL